MNEQLVQILDEIMSASQEEKLTLLENSYEALRPELKEYDPEHNGNVILNIVLSTAIVVDGKTNDYEKVAAQRILKLAGIDMSESEFMEFAENCNKDDAFRVVLNFAKTLSKESKGQLFTFIATIFACDNDIDETEVSYLYDIINE